MGASGGLLVVWNESIFKGETLFKNSFSISVKFTSVHNGDSWILTNIYGPCQDEARAEFIDWFQNIVIPDDQNWLIVGDFNYIRYTINRNREGGNVNDMLAFNEAISALALVEIPIKGREYTWSNMQNAPLLEKLDWVFSSESWTSTYPNTMVTPLSKPISDHTPFNIQIGTSIPRSTLFRFENYWLSHHDFKEKVKSIGEQDIPESDSAKRITAKFKRPRKGIKIWAKDKSQLASTIKDTSAVIEFF